MKHGETLVKSNIYKLGGNLWVTVTIITFFLSDEETFPEDQFSMLLQLFLRIIISTFNLPLKQK